MASASPYAAGCQLKTLVSAQVHCRTHAQQRQTDIQQWSRILEEGVHFAIVPWIYEA